ncbi:Bacitracin transport ATP-binding protein BcrA [Paenibacillus sp. CECT 9249]|uniref:ABC transporter ATP-binding protein n=1 Tax=Paenibacillus sp. CECT 9249 TaxID=2845385 RepID=UPI001E4D4DEB|nr:ABC transporter ATP-binding protein [Paenibacillus sp. CECT 9249]CAH0120461.1 Bacitracin transport ATP-binding protein BcrA [Paenibacillus sp. CECT 9249]
MDIVLQTRKLTKTYKRKRIVSEVDMTVRKGEVYGFLGQNGAGKTTTLRMIMGLVQPTSGEVELFGRNVRQGRHNLHGRIGSIVEVPGFYLHLTAEQNLEIHRRLMGVQDPDTIRKHLKLVGLQDAADKKVKTFSLGMKQRLGIARALLHYPELLILDEPTNGLDPLSMKETREIILNLCRQRELTVLISSHILSEIQQLATRIGIIHQGVLLEQIDYRDLLKKNRSYIQIQVDNDTKAAMLLEQKLGITDYTVWEQNALRLYERLDDAATINEMLVTHGIKVHDISVAGQTLEDYFVRLTGGAT